MADQHIDEAVRAMVQGQAPAYGHMMTAQEWRAAAAAAEAILRARGQWDETREARVARLARGGR